LLAVDLLFTMDNKAAIAYQHSLLKSVAQPADKPHISARITGQLSPALLSSSNEQLYFALPNRGPVLVQRKHSSVHTASSKAETPTPKLALTVWKV